MRKYSDGKYTALTPEEIAAMRAQELQERTRPMTTEEVVAMLIPAQINSLGVDDNTALRMTNFYPAFEEIVGQTVPLGFKFRYGGELWRAEQDKLLIQAHYAPGPGLESLYSKVCETHDGTEDDPIPYNGNMALVAGLYYEEDGVVYRCIRDSGNPVYHALAALVGLYVERV